MKILRTAVVGLGRIGWMYHIPYIIKHKGFELISVFDPSVERLNEAYQTFGVKGYSVFSEMLENEKLDLIVIASPTVFHKEQAITAMNNGIDVFLEKPMTQSLLDADEIINSMRKTNRKLMVYQPHRVTSEFLALKSILDRGVIGQVYMIKRACSAYKRRNDWQSLKKFGGGMLNNYGAHFIDQMLCLCNSKVKEISCHIRTVATLGDADDVVKALMETEDGVILDLDINMATAVELPEWTVLGKRGAISCEIANDGQRVFRTRYYQEKDLTDLKLHSELAAPGREYDNFENIPWREENVLISDFEEENFYNKCYDYYALDRQPFVPVDETREVMRIISECHSQNSYNTNC